jgi:hypothetical protein
MPSHFLHLVPEAHRQRRAGMPDPPSSLQLPSSFLQTGLRYGFVTSPLKQAVLTPKKMSPVSQAQFCHSPARLPFAV